MKSHFEPKKWKRFNFFWFVFDVNNVAEPTWIHEMFYGKKFQLKNITQL